MTDNSIIHRPVFIDKGFCLAEFTPQHYESIGLADCIHIESVKITCFSFLKTPESYLMRQLIKKGLDDTLINRSTFLMPFCSNVRIQAPVNTRLLERFPTLKEGDDYCALPCRGRAPDGILLFKYLLPGISPVRQQTWQTTGSAILFSPKSSIETRVNFCRSYDLFEGIIVIT